MADAAKRAQACPVAGEWEPLFTAGEGTTIISTLRVCNVSGGVDRADIRLALAGEDSSDKQYQCHLTPVPPGLPYSVTEGWTLLEGDVIWVRSLNGMLAFTIFGMETA